MPRPSTPALDLSSDEVAVAEGALESPLSDGDGFFFLRTDEAMLMRRSSAVVMDDESVCDLDPGLRDRSDGYGDDVPDGVDGWCPGVKGPANISLLALSPLLYIVGGTPNPCGVIGDGAMW